MGKHPTLDNYTRLKEAAEKINAWKMVRPKLLSKLEEKKAFGPLTEIYLAEQEWEAAWQAVEQPSISHQHEGWQWLVVSGALELEVAKKTKDVYPHKAIAIFIKHARSQIELRNRDSYRYAVQFLSRVRDLYLQQNEEDAWRAVIEGIRAEFPKLRALQDELKLAGL